VADDVAVMYSGKIVERAPVARCSPSRSILTPSACWAPSPADLAAQERLNAIEGQVPTPMTRMDGCRFAPRCPFAVDKCRQEVPPLMDMGGGHEAACWRAPLDPRCAAAGRTCRRASRPAR
jgi:peptide/nickel transport system ATP-binding protein